MTNQDAGMTSSPGSAHCLHPNSHTLLKSREVTYLILPATPTAAIPVIMVECVIRAYPEDVQTIWSPGRDRGVGDQIAAQVLPAATPTTAIPVFVVETMIGPYHEHVEAIRCPGSHSRSRIGGIDIAVQVLPAAPAGAIPGVVVEGVVRAYPEDVEAVGSPGVHSWIRAQVAAQILPAATPATAIPGLVVEGSIGTQDEYIEAIGSPGGSGGS